MTVEMMERPMDIRYIPRPAANPDILEKLELTLAQGNAIKVRCTTKDHTYRSMLTHARRLSKGFHSRDLGDGFRACWLEDIRPTWTRTSGRPQ